MKITYFTKTLALFFFLAVAPLGLAANNPGNAGANAEARAIELQDRLEEIKSLDKKELSRVEKRELRREVREIKKELAAASGGVYLSVGAIILIALLLILLL